MEDIRECISAASSALEGVKTVTEVQGTGNAPKGLREDVRAAAAAQAEEFGIGTRPIPKGSQFVSAFSEALVGKESARPARKPSFTSRLVEALEERTLPRPALAEGLRVGDMVRVDVKRLTPLERNDIRQVGGDITREVLQIRRDGKVRIGRPGSNRNVANLSDLTLDPKSLIPG